MQFLQIDTFFEFSLRVYLRRVPRFNYRISDIAYEISRFITFFVLLPESEFSASDDDR